MLYTLISLLKILKKVLQSRISKEMQFKFTETVITTSNNPCLGVIIGHSIGLTIRNTRENFSETIPSRIDLPEFAF